MNGVVCMLIPQQKTTDAVWRRTSGIERRKASLFKSLRHFSHPLGPKWVKIVAAKGSDKKKVMLQLEKWERGGRGRGVVKAR